MLELETREDIQPVCPHCLTELRMLWMQLVKGILGKRYIYILLPALPQSPRGIAPQGLLDAMTEGIRADVRVRQNRGSVDLLIRTVSCAASGLFAYDHGRAFQKGMLSSAASCLGGRGHGWIALSGSTISRCWRLRSLRSVCLRALSAIICSMERTLSRRVFLHRLRYNSSM